jgi:hypothetical protein
MQALKDDIYYLRLKQLAWQHYKQEIDKNPDTSTSRAIKSFFDSQQRREMMRNISTKVYEKSIIASAGRLAKGSGLSRHKRKSASPSYILASANLANTGAVSVPRVSRRSQDETLDQVKQARIGWEQGILEELRAIIYEARRPFLVIREPGCSSPWIDASAAAALASSALSNGFNHSSSGDNGPTVGSNTPAGVANGEGVKFLFDSEDLMETILSIRSSNLKSQQIDRYLGMLKLPLHTPEYPELQSRYTELTISYSQLGCDDFIASGLGMKLLAARHEECEQILAQGGSILEARKLMRRGVPPSLRCKIWRLACGLTEKITSSEEQYFLRLRGECDRMDLLSDELFMHDIQTVLDDPRFFVFEEELKEVILSFSRDVGVRQLALYEIHAPLLQQMGSETASFLPPASTFAPSHLGTNEVSSSASPFSSPATTPTVTSQQPVETLAAPPCAVQPYLGFSTYFAPCAYIFQHKVSLYHVTKFLWCRLWCRLNVMTADDGALLSVCKTFESLLIRAHPRLVMHLVSIGLPPIKVAFPWMQLAFVGFLEMEQLLHLWERVIGFMDVTLLAVAAVSIFLFRADMLLQCSNEADAMMVLMEGSRLHIIPVIQAFLMRE